MSVPDLSKLDGLVEEAMAHWDVPGLALAVMQNNDIIKLKAYGTRDMGSGLPVTLDTQFMICSLTKSFTAAGLGLLVDEQKLDWHTRIRDVLPDFELQDPLASEQLTVHDVLTHQSGLPRHDRIWSLPGARSRADMLEAMRYLQPNKALREVWQYNNLGYLVAGAVAERVSGQSWEAFTTDRLLSPLGFTNFGFSLSELEASNDHAHPHPIEAGHAYRGKQWPIQTTPAGGINASIVDMAKWLGFLLSKGRVNGVQLLSQDVVEQMMASHVFEGDSGFSEIGACHYGLGLGCGQYRGDRTVSHTGSTLGWGTMMSMLPDHGIGVAILTNCDPSNVRQLLSYTIFDQLRSREPLDWPDRFRAERVKALEAEETERRKREAFDAQRSEPNLPLAHYAGKYAHPAYGELVVSAESEGLRWCWGGLAGTLLCRDGETFDLKQDGEERLGRFFPTLQFTFKRNAEGVIDRATAPLEPAVDDICFQRRSDNGLPA
ncbi:CubicO group peptidase, beta-lactamase class C family [Paraburkholderia phenazinium]|jgi:CubicO group peptidase (beta-lactamase class C family)|uniref:CubicO group peptidase, beta-lactamase class C family n=1 Tax=Paraburkholderia phenazinium TaxID=60549 RepID=A0A1G8N418_9BURK|nr:serine hydrolase [Paraburkholderia phenazinium]SDI74954.1 CubicO group peptidase, beta-lactamase class C family [Paraburkholderia phenazinium]